MNTSPPRVLTARCPTCPARLRVKTRQAEKRVPCPKCGTQVTARDEPPPASPPRTRSLSADDARRTLRRIAMETSSGGILRQLDQINRQKAARALARYGAELAAGEVPLLLVDRSFTRNGSAGMLLTNRRLFSSRLGQPLRLCEVKTVTYAESNGESAAAYFALVTAPTLLVGLAMLLQVALPCFVYGLVGFVGPVAAWVVALARGEDGSPRLLVNGRNVCKGPLNGGFWTHALRELAAGQAPGPRRRS